MKLSRYLQANGKADAFAALDLFSRDVLFFGAGDLVWDGAHHILHGLRINETYRIDMPEFFRRADEHVNAVVDLLQSLESDEELRVPDRKMHCIVNKALGEGDITGMSLMALAACNRAWRLVSESVLPSNPTSMYDVIAENTGVDLQKLTKDERKRVYVAEVDERLLRAIPGFERVLWQFIGDLRAYNGLEGPYMLAVGGLVIEEADYFFDQFKGVVNGATNEAILAYGSLEDAGGIPEGRSVAAQTAAVDSTSEPVTPTPAKAPVPRVSPVAERFDSTTSSLDPTGRWTFSQHIVAKGTRFSAEVPDGYAVLTDFGGRAFVAMPTDFAAAASEDDSPECVQIYYSGMVEGYDEEAQAILRENGVPEYLAQLSRHLLYGNTATSFGRPVDDWIVEGKNGQVMVHETRLTLFGVSYEYYVTPLAADHHHMLRLADSFSTLKTGELRSLALAIAKTVEFDKPMRYEREEQLKQWLTIPTTVDELAQNANAVGNMLARAGNERINADGLRAKAHADGDNLVPLHRIFASAYTDSLEVEERYLERYVAILRAQRDLVDDDTFAQMWRTVGELIDALMVVEFKMEDNEEFAGYVNDTGLIHLPSGYKKLRDEYEALVPMAR